MNLGLWHESTYLSPGKISARKVHNKQSTIQQVALLVLWTCIAVNMYQSGSTQRSLGRWGLTKTSRPHVSVQECTPFAVIGSNTVVEARGQRVRGRLYPWGIVEGMSKVYDLQYLCGSRQPLAVRTPDWKINLNDISVFSGEPVALWLCETEEHADSFAHARPERRDLRRPLRKLQSAVHTGDDQVRGSERGAWETKAVSEEGEMFGQPNLMMFADVSED